MKWFLRRATAMIPVVALAAAVIGSAHAQVQRPMTVAVLNFSNSSGVGGALLGNRAAAAVEAQMIETGRYDVVKRELVNRTMEDLNLSFPLGRLGITQLATRLEADSVVTGDVLRVSRDPKTNQVKVTMRVEMTDRSSGELVNGAIATSESGIRPDFSGAEDILLDEALNRTAFAAVRTMNDRILPEGTILASSSKEGQTEALLNIGSNSGVRAGMEFIVLRNREQVGRLRATRVSATDSDAVVVASLRGVQPEDKVRAVFRLENIPVEMGGTAASTNRISRPKMNLSNLAVGALALFGIYKITQGKSGTGTPGVRNATAVSTGPNNGAPGANSIPFVPAIRVSWSAPIGVAAQDVVGYGVYRIVESGTAIPAAIVNGSGPRDIIDDGFARDIQEGTTGDEDADFGTGKVHGLSAGVRERYLIRTAYLRREEGTDGTDEGTVTFADEVLSSSATALLPPRAVSVEGSDVSAMTFNFRQVPGGDRYVIQVSANPEFTNPDTYPRSGEGIYMTPPETTGPVGYWGSEVDDIPCAQMDTGSDTACTIFDPRFDPDTTNPYAPEAEVVINLNTGSLDPPSPGRQYYWRVGVRNSRDDRNPERGGYVWGDIVPLTTDVTSSSITLVPTTPVIPPAIEKPSKPIEVDPNFGGMRPGAGRNTGRGR